ncbi:MAG: recombinase family protein [Acidimicrobiia bacterium]
MSGGCVLAEAGRYPNPGGAAIGQQLHVLAPDPVAAPVVARIFDEFIAGKGLYAIAEGLTADGVLSPSAHDRARNPHRQSSGGAWSKIAIRAILQNPRYTGRQVWNRQRRDEVLIDVNDVALGHETKMRWNDRDEWVWSEQPTHEPLVSTEQFEAAQLVFAGAQRSHVRREKVTRGPYVLRGMVRCAICGRRMQGSWNHNQPYYRCKFPAHYAANERQHAKTVNVKEASILPAIDGWLAGLFDADQIDSTCAALEATMGPDPSEEARLSAARRRIRECDTKLARYRSALEAGTDPSIVNGWIEEVKLERRAAEVELRRKTGENHLTSEEIRSLVEQLNGIVGVLANASAESRREIYQQLNVAIEYHTDGRMRVTAGPGACTNECVGGAIATLNPRSRSPWLQLAEAA